MWTVGAYHPLTKHLNLVAEYSNVESEVDDSAEGTKQATYRFRRNLVLLNLIQALPCLN